MRPLQDNREEVMSEDEAYARYWRRERVMSAMVARGRW